MSLPGIPGYIILPRGPAVHPAPPSSCWSSSFIHFNSCRCERCASLAVNGHAPKEQKP